MFKTVVKDTLQDFPPLVESGSEVSHIIPEPRNFAEVTKLLDYIKKPWLKSDLKNIHNLINCPNFLFEYTERDEPVTPCMDIYKDKI